MTFATCAGSDCCADIRMERLMECSWISPAELPGTTRLYSTFLSDFSRVSNFYGHPPNANGIDEAAREIRLEDSVRRAVVDVLRNQNRAFGGDDATTRNLDRLRDGAVAVVTGQQVGLFGGPAYSIYKALTAVHVARELTERGVNAVPVFWLATEDHDLAEVDHCFLPKRGGFERFDLASSGAARPARRGYSPGRSCPRAYSASGCASRRTAGRGSRQVDHRKLCARRIIRFLVREIDGSNLRRARPDFSRSDVGGVAPLVPANHAARGERTQSPCARNSSRDPKLSKKLDFMRR